MQRTTFRCRSISRVSAMTLPPSDSVHSAIRIPPFKKTDFPVANSLFRGILAALWALSSVVEHLVYTEMAGGSNPSAPTILLWNLGQSACIGLRWNSTQLQVMLFHAHHQDFGSASTGDGRS